ncbi:MAG: uracil-DNA glycosylase [Bacteroidota bacterium]|jgi:uracil-DNA glycosylase|nr:uracil-DNA glycosylase [Bacteroidota bacterium]
MLDLISDPIWHRKLESECNEPYFKSLQEFVLKERNQFTVYPPEKDTFTALNLTSLKEIKAVILGQDPYHQPRQAHGLSFSVNYGIKIPPSLGNIYKELKTDIGFVVPNHGNLTSWARQGVLLLNATLTVRAGEPGSHQKKGWETFTNHIIQTISDENEHCVFMLWGNFAKTKADLIDPDKHLILETAHPSPLARGGFFGCKHFSKTNQYLNLYNRGSINWNLSDYGLFDERANS